jgi:bacterioferritin-associated ferredoxin
MVREGARSVADIARRSGAGLCCAPCRREIAALVATASPNQALHQASAEA